MEDWGDLSDTEKGRYLVAATRRLDALNWQGEKAVSTQATEWPRIDIEPVPSADIPPELEKATILLAGDLAWDPSGETAADSVNEDVQSEAVGPINAAFFTRRRDTSAQRQSASQARAHTPASPNGLRPRAHTQRRRRSARTA